MQGLLHGEVALTEGSEEFLETPKLCPQDTSAHQGYMGAEGSVAANRWNMLIFIHSSTPKFSNTRIRLYQAAGSYQGLF